MNFVSGISEGLPKRLCLDLANYRHKIFVERLGWQLQIKDGAELDQFDRPDTVYVVAKDERNGILGCARLLPTTRPYLLGEVFPQLLNGLTPPCSPEVWELSRFAAMDFNNQMNPAAGQFSSPVAIQLMHESLACAARLGAKRLITVSPLGVERLLRKAGFRAHRAGPPIIVDQHPLFACWIEVCEDSSSDK